MTTGSLREPQIMIRTGYGRLFSLSRDQEQQCCQRQAASAVLLTDRTGPRRASTATDMANAGEKTELTVPVCHLLLNTGRIRPPATGAAVPG